MSVAQHVELVELKSGVFTPVADLGFLTLSGTVVPHEWAPFLLAAV